MGASCGRWCAYEDSGVGSSPRGVELGGHGAEPFITLKARGPKSLENIIQAANALVARHDWISSHALPERYVVGRALGKGATGTVRQATRKTDGLFCAVKSVPKAGGGGTSLANVEAFLAEAAILRRLDHPNVVKCLDTVDDGICLHAVLENCAGGDLFDWFLSLPQYTEETIASIIADITGAVSHCHQHGVVHRDLKPENILFYKSFGGGGGRGGAIVGGGGATVKLCDFGCAFQLDMGSMVSADAAVLSAAQMKSLVGSSYYIAPEVLRQQGLYTAAVDLWSLGVIAYLLVSGSPPFDGDSEEEIQAQVLRGEASFDVSVRRGRNNIGGFSAEARDFISSLLQRDPALRLSAKDAQAHPWLEGVGSGVSPKATGRGDPRRRYTNQRRHHKVDPRASRERFAGVAAKIKEFSALPQVKRTILAALGKQLTEEQALVQTKLFRKLDVNRDGHLGADEMKRAGVVDTPTARRFGGHLTYSEWLAATTDVTFHDDVLLRFFQRFDSGGTGWVSLLDIEARLAKDSDAMRMRRTSLRGTAVSPKVAQRKVVNFEQFKRFLRARSQRLSQVLSPHGEHHATVVVEAYVGDSDGDGDSGGGGGGAAAAERIVQLGSPPHRRLKGATLRPEVQVAAVGFEGEL